MLTLGYCYPMAPPTSSGRGAPSTSTAVSPSSRDGRVVLYRAYGDEATLRGSGRVGWVPGVDPTLGAYVPTDDDLLAVQRCYYPVHSRPPGSLGEVAPTATPTFTPFQRLSLAISTVSALAIVANSMVNITRTLRATP